MNESKKIILLKLTGACLIGKNKELDTTLINDIAKQIYRLRNQYHFAIVIGGGNLFRGNQQGDKLQINPKIRHQIGMIATVINGLLIQDSFQQNSIDNIILSSIENNFTGKFANQDSIEEAIHNNKTIIFVAGTGNPFFTTDTASILRAFQINAHEIWKASNIDGVYDQDPKKNCNAVLIKKMKLQDAINSKIGVMDQTAFVLAQQYSLPIRIFNIFESQALLKAAQDTNFGSLIS